MMIREAMEVFWQSLKDLWEELYSLGLVNLVWVFSLAPLALITVSQAPVVVVLALLLTVLLFPTTTVGMYFVTNRVAQGRTFHFSDFIEGCKRYWWRSLIWLAVNAGVLFLIRTNLMFYPDVLADRVSPLVIIGISGLWLALGVFWLAIQVYYWPMLIQQQQTKLFVAWKNAAFLLLANPFYAFFVISFTFVLFALSVLLTLPFIFVGMALVGVIGNNAVIRLLIEFNVIEDPRPKPLP